MKKNFTQDTLTIDQRLRTIKDTVDKMSWDIYNHPKTVTKNAEEFLKEDMSTMKQILKDVSEAQLSLESISDLLSQTNQFCEDIGVQIQNAYDMFGLDIPNTEELLGEDIDENNSEKETSETEEDMDHTLENVKKDDSDSLQGVTFYEPTPAKPAATSHKKLYF